MQKYESIFHMKTELLLKMWRVDMTIVKRFFCHKWSGWVFKSTFMKWYQKSISEENFPTPQQGKFHILIRDYLLDESFNDTPLSTLGPNNKLIRTSTEASTNFTSRHLLGFQADLGFWQMKFSNWQTRLLAQDLGVATGSRKAMEHGFNESHTKNSQTVDDFSKS